MRCESQDVVLCDASVQYMFCDAKDFATLIIDFSSVGATSAPGHDRSFVDVASMSGLLPKAAVQQTTMDGREVPEAAVSYRSGAALIRKGALDAPILFQSTNRARRGSRKRPDPPLSRTTGRELLRRNGCEAS